MPDKHEFAEQEKRGVYRAIRLRRDIRSQFKPDPIPDQVMARLLYAGHVSGSVGFMQPWNFILIRDLEVRKKVKAVFEKENQAASANYQGERRGQYLSFKLEGILESSVNLCVTCDTERGGPHVLGRNTIRETDLFSTCCAIQNLWLAARSEGIGMGWVSILNHAEVKDILNIPPSVTPVAYLCLGYVTEFPARPMLEEAGWEKRISLEELVYFERWQEQNRADLGRFKRYWEELEKEIP